MIELHRGGFAGKPPTTVIEEDASRPEDDRTGRAEVVEWQVRNFEIDWVQSGCAANLNKGLCRFSRMSLDWRRATCIKVAI